MPTAKQIGWIHGLATKAGLDDDAYRGLLAQYGGVTSSRDLSVAGFERVLGRLKVLTGGTSATSRPARPAAEGALALQGPFTAKLRALWLTAWNLGLTASRTDRSLAEFVSRQPGLDSPSWVRDPADARKAIEGLKAWIARESGLVWPKDPRDLRGLKFALVRRQWELLIEGGQPIRFIIWSDLADYAAEMIRRASPQAIARPLISMTLDELTPDQFDALASALGARIRKQKQKRAQS